MDRKVQSANVAYERDYIENLLISNHLTILHNIEGTWGGKNPKQHISYQDMIIFSKQ